MKKITQGLLIPFYGINNLGKTTQAKLTVEALCARGYDAVYQKYAVYDLEPSGPLINEVLRSKNPYNLPPIAFQTLQALNRTQFEPQLKQWLAEGKIIIAEDYTGTGLAWGIGAGLSKEYLMRVNSHLLKEDMAFYFHGKRFTQAVEKGHLHEENDELTNTVSTAHAELATELGWIPVHANRDIPIITEEILQHILSYIAEKQLDE